MASAKSVQIELQKLVNESNTEGYKYNSAEAAKSREWSREMSDTSHQREVKDLIKAGLNPVLSANTGAQSYTGASANYAAQNAANAVASLYSSEWSAQATKKAAATGAAATRAAAAASAAATKYAANMNYASTVYNADKALEATKYSVDNSKSGTWAGIIEKWTHKLGANENVQNMLTNLWNSGKEYLAASATLSQFGIPNTKTNRNIATKAANGNKKAQKQFNSLAKQYISKRKFK